MSADNWFWAVWAIPPGKSEQSLVEIYPPGSWQLAVKLAARLEKRGYSDVEVLKELEGKFDEPAEE